MTNIDRIPHENRLFISPALHRKKIIRQAHKIDE